MGEVLVTSFFDSAPRRFPPSEKAARQARLQSIQQRADVIRVSTDKLVHAAELSPQAVTDVQFRVGYAFQEVAATEGSDRRLPPVSQRPPLAQLITSRGVALRLHLLALADAQMKTRPGRKPSKTRPIAHSPSPTDESWRHLLPTTAVDQHKRRVSVDAMDKRLRQIHNGLKRMEEIGLVELPNKNHERHKYEDFRLLNEAVPTRAPDANEPYTAPRKSEATFSVPLSFFTRGWIHVLEDSEIAVLFMVACGRGSLPGNGVAIPSGVRTRQYGIGRDNFAKNLALERAGLLEVHTIDRHQDGRAVDFGDRGASLHRIRLLREGFDQDALSIMAEVLADD